MLKQQIALIFLDKEKIIINKNENQAFYDHFQQSILLSLLEQKKLTQWQFERCMELLNKQKI